MKVVKMVQKYAQVPANTPAIEAGNQLMQSSRLTSATVECDNQVAARTMEAVQSIP
jgi:hypothetical protein